jgi:hypothetical protein
VIPDVHHEVKTEKKREEKKNFFISEVCDKDVLLNDARLTFYIIWFFVEHVLGGGSASVVREQHGT